MPRYIPERTRRRVAYQRERRFERVQTGYKRWVDPFPNVMGTRPEKMVYAALVERRIPFWFQNEVQFKIPELKIVKDYRPDIVLYTLKIIIEVQGSYWHSKDQAIKDDAYKFAIYETTGWKVLVWWDYEIEENIHKLFAADPVLSKYGFQYDSTASTERNNGRKIIRDDTKGVRTMNYNRGQRMAYKKKPVSIVRKNKGQGVMNRRNMV